MLLQFSDDVRNAMLDAITTVIGASAVLKIRTGAAPTDEGAADSGTVLATLNLPSTYMAAASGGSKSMTGTWTDSSADNSGTAGHWRLYTNGGTCKSQGDVTATGNGGSVTVDNVVFAAGQPFSITAWTFTQSG